ncbi:sulfurtransferase TusA family protein [Streptomyces sp. NPDC002520]
MSDIRPGPAVVVEAGGEPWSRVGPLLDRRTSEIAAGGAIEILTADPGVRAALPGWCARRGATLETTSQRDGTVGYLVRLVGGRPGEHT